MVSDIVLLPMELDMWKSGGCEDCDIKASIISSAAGEEGMSWETLRWIDGAGSTVRALSRSCSRKW